jgi:hypothetical protein
MKPQDLAALHKLVRDVLQSRDDHDIKDKDQREVVVDDLCRLLTREFNIKLRAGFNGSID